MYARLGILTKNNSPQIDPSSQSIIAALKRLYFALSSITFSSNPMDWILATLRVGAYRMVSS